MFNAMFQTPLRPMTARGDRRRAALLQAATDVFLEHGFEAASLDDVIRRAGGSRSMIYEQFDDKEGLFAAIIAKLCDSITAPLTKALSAQQPPAHVLTDFAMTFLDRLMEPAGLALYRVVIAESRRFPKLGSRVFAVGPEAAAEQLTSYLHRATRRGELHLRNPGLAARIFLEMIKGDLHTRALFGARRRPSQKEIRACVRTAVTTFLHGTAGKASGPHIQRPRRL
jgi:AcrR family transcriptional regulator